jgi:Na+-transporting methylmalonyl-CoA/oxaloacetate decarboxylase gamma subunit
MNNLMVGFEILLSGVATTFIVLIFLMFVIKLMSVLVGKEPAKMKVAGQPLTTSPDELKDEEFVAMMAVLSKLLPEHKQAVVRFREIKSAGGDEDESVAAMVAAISGMNKKIVSLKSVD